MRNSFGGSDSVAILPPAELLPCPLWGPFRRHGGWAPEAVMAPWGGAPEAVWGWERSKEYRWLAD